MEWKGMTIPCMLTGAKNIMMGNDFTIKAVIKPDIIGGKQSIISKRIPSSSGNRPGFILLLHGSCVELMTFEEGGESWVTARTLSRVIQVGQTHEILAFRADKEARIYVNGIDRTDKRYDKVSGGDISCPMDAFVGMQLYNKMEPREVFTGKIFMIGLYDDAYFNDAKGIRFQKNPNVFSLSQLPGKYPKIAERMGM